MHTCVLFVLWVIVTHFAPRTRLWELGVSARLFFFFEVVVVVATAVVVIGMVVVVVVVVVAVW